VKPNQIEIHYFLPVGVHSADAFAIAKAESEFIHLIKEVACHLDISLKLETQAISEGGIIQKWKAFDANAAGIGCVIGIMSLIMTILPDSDEELIDLQKEEARLHIQLLKKELSASESPSRELIEETAGEISSDIKIVKRRSNFYQAIQSEAKIEAIELTPIEDETPTDEPVRVERNEFSDFIALTGELPTEIDEDAVIEIISPVLKKGRFKWKGYYKDALIEFWLQDKEFKESVLRKEVDFHSGTAIGCVLEMRIKVDEVGIVSRAGYYVKVVKTVLEYESEKITTSGEEYLIQQETEKAQLKLILPL
jgi:hypothetical protein